MTTLEIITHYIATTLALPASVAALDSGQPVAVYDVNDGRQWRNYHKRAVATFRDAWRIAADPSRKRGYLFWRKD